MVTIYLRTYPEGTKFWKLSIGAGADWLTGALGLGQPALVPPERAGSIEWLIISALGESGRDIAPAKTFRTAVLEDGIIYGVYWNENALAVEGSEQEEEQKEQASQRREILQYLVYATVVGMMGMIMLKAVKE